MKYAKKMILLDYDIALKAINGEVNNKKVFEVDTNEQAGDEAKDFGSNTQNTIVLEQLLNEIINNSMLSDEEKISQYKNVLQKYTFLKNEKAERKRKLDDQLSQIEKATDSFLKKHDQIAEARKRVSNFSVSPYVKHVNATNSEKGLLKKLMVLETPFPSSSNSLNNSDISTIKNDSNQEPANLKFIRNAPARSSTPSFNLSDCSVETPSPFATTIKKRDIRLGDEVIRHPGLAKTIVRRNLESFYLDEDDDDDEGESQRTDHSVQSNALKKSDVVDLHGSGRKKQNIRKNSIILRWSRLPKK